MIYSPARRTSFCPREPDPARHLPPELLALASLGHVRPSIHVFPLQTSEASWDPDPGQLLGPHDSPVCARAPLSGASNSAEGRQTASKCVGH